MVPGECLVFILFLYLLCNYIVYTKKKKKIAKDRVITDENKISEIFNQCFGNIVSHLGVKVPDTFTHHSTKVKDPILNTISKRILKNCKNHFLFKATTLDDVENRFRGGLSGCLTWQFLNASELFSFLLKKSNYLIFVFA